MTHDPGNISVTLFVVSSICIAASGITALFPFVSPLLAQRFSAFNIVVSSITGIISSINILLNRTAIIWILDWNFPFGPASTGVDPLTAFFALPIFVIAACGAVYGLGYWRPSENLRTSRKLTFFFGLLAGMMLFVTIARSAGIFLLSWEIMALAAYFAITADDHNVEVRDAGTLYLICTHIGTLILFAFFILLKGKTGEYAFPAPFSVETTTLLSSVIFLLSLIGFGFKAGIMPFHVWLPSAHANAPSHVSALMSGVILKIGIYGIIRSLSFFSSFPLWWGILILCAGVISGVVGVLFAIGQHDIKRLLAYHSIENIGIILMGLGVAVTGAASASPVLLTLGIAGALLHVLNHATFKGLLFLGAGSIIHASGTREIDKMGGLLKSLPVTAAAFLVGAAAICGLPPLNGFVSELLVYLGFMNTVITTNSAATVMAAVAAPALAVVGGLAVACFVKVFGTVFLGSPREGDLHQHHEAPKSMLIPMIALSLLCLLIGAGSFMFAPLLYSASSSFSTLSLPVSQLAPLNEISAMALLLILFSIIFYLYYSSSLEKRKVDSGSTWGCGYLAPTARMQYTASSFAEIIVKFSSGILRPITHLPKIKGIFPQVKHFSSHVPEAVLELVYIPALECLYQKGLPIRRMQSGLLQQYVLYILITLVAVFVSGYFY